MQGKLSFRWKYIGPQLVIAIVSIPLAVYFYSQLPSIILTSGEGGTQLPREIGMLAIPLGIQWSLVLINIAILWYATRKPNSSIKGVWRIERIAPKRIPAYFGSIFVLVQLFILWTMFHIFRENLHGEFYPIHYLVSIAVFFTLFLVTTLHPRWRAQ